jgi:hypothetical protein
VKKVRKVEVDCCPNDPVDIRCGGPRTLGFDFSVAANDKEIEKFIRTTLAECKLPCQGVWVEDEVHLVPNKDMWTRSRIRNCIKRDQNVRSAGRI